MKTLGPKGDATRSGSPSWELPVLRHGEVMSQAQGCLSGERPRTWATLQRAARGNILARRMLPVGYMELILTADCNMKCSYCFEKDKQALDMSEATAFTAVDFLIRASRNLKDLTILFFGGEPMLRFDLLQRVHEYATRKVAAAGKKLKWNMTTNGTLIDEAKARWLARHKVKYLLSLDGAKEDHDRHRRFPNGEGSFDLIAARLSMLRRYQPWVGTKMSVAPEAAGRLCENIKALSDLGMCQFIYGYAHGTKWTDEALAAFTASMLRLCELYLQMKHEKRHFRITGFEEDGLCKANASSPFGCGAGRGRFCVDPRGDIYGCSKLCTIHGPGKGINPLGNVFQGFTNVENRLLCFDDSDKRRPTCRGCEFHDTCSGGCPATNHADTGSVFVSGDVACKMVPIMRRVNDYMRRRHDEVFGSDWCESHGSERL
jgi:uncharacterized protein